MTFRVVRTKEFDKSFSSLPKKEQLMINKFEEKLSENPFLGKALGYKFLREKRLNSRRVYYLIYIHRVLVLMVAVGDKKAQKLTISIIKKKLQWFMNLAVEIK